ncbi:MAG: hypothetical protein IJJ41_06105 [Clostridia bacterium]|nr:hypothetical protein [Clostridia bacterium]
MKQRKNRIFITFSAVFLSLCLTLGLYTLLRPAKDFSVRENRKLASMPHFSFSALWDGSYTQDLNAYFNDHFGGRDMWTGVNLSIKKALGQKENGGVYLGKKGQLYLKPEEPNQEALDRNVKAMNAFQKDFKKVRNYVCIVPNAVSVQNANLPKGAPVPDQAAFLKSIEQKLEKEQFVDVSAALKEHNDEYIYYLTDHHWTSLGAKTAFEQLAGQMKLKNVIKDYDVLTVSDSFRGTLSSKSGSFSARDTVDVYIPKTDLLYSVEYVGAREKSASMYKTAELENNDKYTVFFGGNHPRIDIQTTAQTGRNLLVFKDSYFNCMAQFLWPYFDSITIIDPRYYYDYAGDIIGQEDITDVLYLYNADTFGTDTSLYAVLEAAK